MEANSREKQIRYDDEISLVDLASTFLRRRRVFYGVFLLSLLAGIVYALLATEKYNYTSLVKLAENGAGEYIQKPAVVIATFENRWFPECQSNYHAEHDRALPFKVTFSNPGGTGLIRIASEASSSQRESVKQFHTKLINQMVQAQSAAISRLRKSLEKQIESLSSTIDMLEGTKDSGVAVASAVEQKSSREAALESIQSMEVFAVSRKSVEKTGLARSLIILLAGLLGLMAGIFLAFIAEFVGMVRERMAEM